jgi:hypothetical protein
MRSFAAFSVIHSLFLLDASGMRLLRHRDEPEATMISDQGRLLRRWHAAI